MLVSLTTSSGELTPKLTRTPKESVFKVRDNDIHVRWISIDFESDPDYANIPERYVLCGVQYIPAQTPDGIDIRTSNKISDNCQGLSALHEKLCMVDKVASCAEVEAIVVDAAVEPDVRAEYIAFRKVMFSILIADNPSNEAFAHTLDYLNSLT